MISGKKVRQSKPNAIWTHLYAESEIRELIETLNRLVVAKEKAGGYIK